MHFAKLHKNASGMAQTFEQTFPPDAAIPCDVKLKSFFLQLTDNIKHKEGLRCH